MNYITKKGRQPTFINCRATPLQYDTTVLRQRSWHTKLHTENSQ